MEIFKLLGTIAVDNQTANDGIDKTTNKAESARSRISDAFSKIGHAATVAGKTIATGLAAGVTAMSGLTVKALNLGGELEQNMGGSEAVFGDYAEKMQDAASEAFGKMGLSASDYLATANKMGALFKGAGFEIAEASDLTAEAMERAADVASIMGLDTTSAMEAIAGAAKGNFTMMDNLGVAMNDTAIEAYALSKGINKATKDMSQQEKIGLAMEMFLDKTAYAAGNYAKENRTLAGSLGTAKAALTNFLDGSGSVDALAQSFVSAAGVIVENLQNLLPRLVEGLGQLATQLLPHLPVLIETLLPGLIDGATTLLTGLAEQLPVLIQTVLPSLTEGAATLLIGLAQALPGLAVVLIEQIPVIIGEIRTALETAFPELEEPFAVIEGMFTGIWEACEIVWNEIGKPIFDAVSSVFSAAKDALQPLIDKFTEYVLEGEFAKDATEAVRAAVDALKTAYEAVVGFISDVVQGFKDAVTWCQEHETAVTLLGIAFGTLTAAIIAYNVANGVKQAGGIVELAQLAATAIGVGALTVAETAHTVATTIATAATTAFSAALSFLTSPITLVVAAIGALIAIVVVCVKHWDEIKEAASAAWDAIKRAWEVASTWFDENIIQPIVEFFTGLWDGVKEAASAAWDFVKGAWESASTWFDENIIQPIVKFFTDLWDGIEEAASAAWDFVKGAWETASTWFDEKIVQPVAEFFTGMWDGIKKGATTAWNFVRDIWGAVKDWFDRKIVQPLSKLFTDLWEGIKTAFKTPINWIIDGINLFIRGINKIKIPDWVPVVGGKGFHINELPKLETGGVLEKGQVGLLEGSGAEAVVPLDQNKAWISAVAKDMGAAIGGDNKLLEDIKELLETLVTMLPGTMTNAFKSMKFDVNNREFARLVKAVN